MTNKSRHINPSFRASKPAEFSMDQGIRGLREGDFDLIAQLISKAESKLLKDQAFIRELLMQAKPVKETRKIAVSGAPGVGKSSFIDSFGHFITTFLSKKVAVLPVDPSSQLSKGSILGDKTRMERLSISEKAFIKPMSSSLSLGGLAPASAVASMICERSDFDYIIFETVGVGQSEIEARNISDMFILLLQPGGGDELQGIKRGIMEMADLFIITKSDGSLLDNADATLRQIRQANSLLLKNAFGWKPSVIKHSSYNDEGNDSALEKISAYYEFMNLEGRLDRLRKEQESQLFKKQSNAMLLDYVLNNQKLSDALSSLSDRLNKGELEALGALENLQNILDDLV